MKNTPKWPSSDYKPLTPRSIFIGKKALPWKGLREVNVLTHTEHDLLVIGTYANGDNKFVAVRDVHGGVHGKTVWAITETRVINETPLGHFGPLLSQVQFEAVCNALTSDTVRRKPQVAS